MIELNELQDSAQKAFPADQLVPGRDQSWELIAEMGWLMTRLAEDEGGLGLGRDASTMLHYEMGRVLSSMPIAPALLAIDAIGSSGTLANKEDWIERTCAGEFITTNLSGGDASLSGDDTLDAHLPNVPDADMASHVMVFAPELAVLVPCDADGVAIEEHELWDKSRRLFSVSLNGFKVDDSRVLARGDDATSLAERLLGELDLALAADSLGGAAAIFEMTVEYLKTRKQFDRPLAMFQALKHRCADLKTQITASEALLWSRATEEDVTALQLGALKALACDVYQFVAEEAIQLHGGIGLTEEHPCHLFMKRSFLNLSLGGTSDEWQEATGRQAYEALV